MSLSKKTRFEVFKRDQFTCQYCGMKAPEVVLEVDHIHPKSKGGKNDLLNLITSCAACNNGKGANTLDDKTVVQKQRSQLEELQAKREQIDMMLAWQKGLSDLSEYAVDQVCALYEDRFRGWELSDNGRSSVRSVLTQVPLDVALAQLRMSADRLLRTGENGNVTEESARDAFALFERECRYWKMRSRDPVGMDMRYIRGILKNRLDWIDLPVALEILTDAHRSGVSSDKLKITAQTATGWNSWRANMERLVAAAKAEAKP